MNFRIKCFDRLVDKCHVTIYLKILYECECELNYQRDDII